MNTIKKLYEERKIHTTVVTSYRFFKGWADEKYYPVLEDNRARFKAIWGKADFYFSGSHYFHVWVKKFQGETFLVLTAKDHGTVIEIVRDENAAFMKIDAIRDFAEHVRGEIERGGE